MKVLMLNGSAKANGNTYRSLLEVGKQLEKEGIEYEIFQIGGEPVRDCWDVANVQKRMRF